MSTSVKDTNLQISMDWTAVVHFLAGEEVLSNYQDC